MLLAAQRGLRALDLIPLMVLTWDNSSSEGVPVFDPSCSFVCLCTAQHMVCNSRDPTPTYSFWIRPLLWFWGFFVLFVCFFFNAACIQQGGWGMMAWLRLGAGKLSVLRCPPGRTRPWCLELCYGQPDVEARSSCWRFSLATQNSSSAPGLGLVEGRERKHRLRSAELTGWLASSSSLLVSLEESQAVIINF